MGAADEWELPDPDVGNPRAENRRSSAELVRAVRSGRRIAEALRGLDARAAEPDADDLALAEELARFLVRRCEDRHAGWRALRTVLLDHGADVPWERAERAAVGPTAERVLADCAAPGRTPLVRVQHAAAQERARVVARHLDRGPVLRRLKIVPDPAVDDGVWEEALVAAVRARSRERVATLIAGALR